MHAKKMAKRPEKRKTEHGVNGTQKKVKLNSKCFSEYLDKDDYDFIKNLSNEIQNRVEIQELEESSRNSDEMSSSYRHKRVLPKNTCLNWPESVNAEQMYRQYTFELDRFQAKAIDCVHAQESVLVAAHTSSGKTAIAEYAIAQTLHNTSNGVRSRVIYTTPIKALSNQKYQNLSNEFESVGLMTGDVTINTNASCLIVTTEILRKMLYTNYESEILKETDWIVFDEMHYMQDRKRGVIWEECIIALPSAVRCVFLSATIANALEFAEWFVVLHQQPIHVISNDRRPVPLQHYLCSESVAIDLVPVCRSNGEIDDAAIEKCFDVDEKTIGQKADDDSAVFVTRLIQKAIDFQFLPLIAFCFNRKKCSIFAKKLDRFDLVTAEEKELIHQVYKSAMDTMPRSHRNLPAASSLFQMLRRGIAIHHGGMLAILREIVEILFQEGVIKVLFATETFGMGLNMPARTVVFMEVAKFDGISKRLLNNSEFIQMCGRAGRRGHDNRGVVITVIEAKGKMPAMVSAKSCQSMFANQPDCLKSAFRLTYHTILNLIRSRQMTLPQFLRRTFAFFQKQSEIPKLFNEMRERLRAVRQSSNREFDYTFADLKAYQTLMADFNDLEARFLTYYNRADNLRHFLKTGRLIRVQYNDVRPDWGVLLRFKKWYKKNSENNNKKSIQLTLSVLVRIASEIQLIEVGHENVVRLSTVVLKMPRNWNEQSSLQRRELFKSIDEIEREMSSGENPNGIPELMNVIGCEDGDFASSEYEEITQKMEQLKLEISANKFQKIVPCTSQAAEIEKFAHLTETRAELVVICDRMLKLAKFDGCDLSKELECKMAVLRNLNWLSDGKNGSKSGGDLLTVKGDVACSLLANVHQHQLLLVELLFDGFFGNHMSPVDCAALLSVFVCDETQSHTKQYEFARVELQTGFERIRETSERMKSVTGTNEANAEELRPFLVNATEAWAKGIDFQSICKLCDFQEGLIVRSVRNLIELLQQLIEAANRMGSLQLKRLFNSSLCLLEKDDVISVPSLYL